VIDTHLLIIAQGLSGGARLRNASGVSRAGDPYLRLFLSDGVLLPGESTLATLVIQCGSRDGDMGDHDDAPVSYTLELLSGQGRP
jgi:hypothetical protein